MNQSADTEPPHPYLLKLLISDEFSDEFEEMEEQVETAPPPKTGEEDTATSSADLSLSGSGLSCGDPYLKTTTPGGVERYHFTLTNQVHYTTCTCTSQGS